MPLTAIDEDGAADARIDQEVGLLAAAGRRASRDDVPEVKRDVGAHGGSGRSGTSYTMAWFAKRRLCQHADEIGPGCSVISQGGEFYLV